MDSVKAVTPAAVRAVARAVFRNDRMNFSAVGPYRDGDAFKKIMNL